MSKESRIFKALSNDNRLAIVKLLCRSALSVNEIVDKTNLPQSGVSNHLGVLLNCGVVAYTRVGNRMYYRLDNGTVKRIMAVLEE